MSQYPNGKHPNSLKNLVKITDSDKAREYQAKGAEVRRKNKEMRDALKLSMAEFKKVKDEIVADTPAMIDYMKVQWAKAIQENDHDQAMEIAKVLIKYETPELSRVDSTTLDLTTEDLSDEELDAKLNEYLKK